MRENAAAAPRVAPGPPPATGDAWAPHRVLLITPRWARDGGVGAHVVASAAALAGRGVEVIVAAGRIESRERIPGVTLTQQQELLNRKTSMESRLGEALSCAPALAHLHQVDDPDVVGALRATAPVVISAHGYTACTSGVHYFQPGHECTRAHGPGCIPNLPACSHVRNPSSLPGRYKHASRGLRALLAADLAISYSSAVDRHLAANGVVHRRRVPYFPTTPAGRIGGPEAPRRVLFAGRVIAAKGVHVLIRAATQVDGEFVICGAGRQLEEMRRLASRLHVDERVRFTGWLSPEELGGELAAASVVVLPSIWPEPFGIVAIEAFAVGRPVIASATGGVGDWLEDGVNGLAVPPGDAPALARALSSLLADPERRRAMGEAGRISAPARYSAQSHLSALLDAYRAATQTWQPTRPAGAIRLAAQDRQVALG
jgi:glycosyltransferase involved in cell wall biosynthesis